MTDAASARADALLAALPFGTVTGRWHDRRYHATKIAFAGGRSIKFEARTLGGLDHLSANLYRTSAGPRLFPCETTAERVLAFLEGFEPDCGPPERPVT